MKKNRVVSVVSEEKERREHSHIFHLNRSEVEQRCECSQPRKTA